MHHSTGHLNFWKVVEEKRVAKEKGLEKLGLISPLLSN